MEATRPGGFDFDVRVSEFRHSRPSLFKRAAERSPSPMTDISDRPIVVTAHEFRVLAFARRVALFCPAVKQHSRVARLNTAQLINSLTGQR